MIILMGHLHLNPAEVPDFMADMQIIATGTRAEAGCLFYALAVDDAPAGRVLLAQRWQNQAALTAHMEGANAAAFASRWGYRVRVDLQRYAVSTGSKLLQT
jgi:quinol monooxygenase YgiN